MERQEFVTEENYEKGKKKLKTISLIILIVGITIGLGLIISGAVLSHNAKPINIDLNPQQENNNSISSRTEEEIQEDINTITPKINSIRDEVTTLDMKLWKIKMEEGMSDNYKAKQQEKEIKEKELLDLQSKLKKYQTELNNIEFKNSMNDIDNGMGEQVENIFNTASKEISKGRFVPFYIFGGFIIVASSLISLAIFLFAKKREITAFTAQQTMPIAQEGIEKMAPTVGNAVGTIGKDLAKGIKEGINEANNMNTNNDN